MGETVSNLLLLCVLHKVCVIYNYFVVVYILYLYVCTCTYNVCVCRYCYFMYVLYYDIHQYWGKTWYDDINDVAFRRRPILTKGNCTAKMPSFTTYPNITYRDTSAQSAPHTCKRRPVTPVPNQSLTHAKGDP